MTGKRKTLAIRLEDETANAFAALAREHGVNQTALVSAAIELWVWRWKDANGDVADWAARYSDNMPGPGQTLWEAWLARARSIEAQRKARKSTQ